MTTENLIELFEKSVGFGTNFMTNLQHLSGRYMEFSYTVQEKNTTPQHLWRGLGRMCIVCELSPEDYISDRTGKTPFGVNYYIKYDSQIDRVNAFKFTIDSEIFSKLIRLYRVKETEETAKKDVKKIEDFKKRMDTIENQYAIEVSSSQRHVITEKNVKH